MVIRPDPASDNFRVHKQIPTAGSLRGFTVRVRPENARDEVVWVVEIFTQNHIRVQYARVPRPDVAGVCADCPATTT